MEQAHKLQRIKYIWTLSNAIKTRKLTEWRGDLMDVRSRNTNNIWPVHSSHHTLVKMQNERAETWQEKWNSVNSLLGVESYL